MERVRLYKYTSHYCLIRGKVRISQSLLQLSLGSMLTGWNYDNGITRYSKFSTV